RGCMVGHHTRIGAYSTISTGANIAGRVTIGQRAYNAMGAVNVTDIQIGPSSMVGAGALVTRDVPERVQVLGVPAMIAREDFDGY
ncbi:MAG: acetyltransferase, partial [Anaerolineae bacterium]